MGISRQTIKFAIIFLGICSVEAIIHFCSTDKSRLLACALYSVLYSTLYSLAPVQCIVRTMFTKDTRLSTNLKFSFNNMLRLKYIVAEEEHMMPLFMHAQVKTWVYCSVLSVLLFSSTSASSTSCLISMTISPG